MLGCELPVLFSFTNNSHQLKNYKIRLTRKKVSVIGQSGLVKKVSKLGMKLFFSFVIFVAFCNVKGQILHKAFKNIFKDNLEQDDTLTIVSTEKQKDKSDSKLFFLVSDIPRVVTRFKNETPKFELSSSAIMFLDSVASLEVFNNRTILSLTFSMSQQLFIYCQDGSFEKIEKMWTFRETKPIVQYEYFLVEDDYYVQLLTFIWYAPGKCD